MASRGSGTGMARPEEAPRYTSMDQVVGRIYNLCKDQYGNLYAKYERSFWWFELAIMLRKLLLVYATYGSSATPLFQVMQALVAILGTLSSSSLFALS